MLSVMASNHQCHPKYFGQGRQCVANSYAAMMHHSAIKKASKWTKKDLDAILLEGDNVYYNIMMAGQLENYLLVTDLPNQWNNCELKILKCDAGSISRVACKPYKPYVSLTETIGQIEKFLFLTIGCYTKAVLKDKDMYHVFDPHSRNSSGMVAADGKAVLTSYSTLENLALFLEKFAFSLIDANSEVIPFEATHVEIINGTITSDSDDFEGFSDISEGEYSCILQIIKDTKDEKIQNIEDELEQLNSDESYEDNIPLSKLSKLLKHENFSSDSDHISSGSEYKFSQFEKKMLDKSSSESSSSDFESGKKKKKKSKKRKFKKRKDVNNTSTKLKVDALVSTDVTEHNYCSKGEGMCGQEINVEGTLMSGEEEIVSDVVEVEQDMNVESEQYTAEEISMERIFDYIGQDLDIAGEITVEGVFEEESVGLRELHCNELENDFNIEMGQDFNITGEITVVEVNEEEMDVSIAADTIESADGNIADSSMQELVGDVSFDGCVSGNLNTPDHARGRKRTRNPDNWRRNKVKRDCNTGQRHVNSKGTLQQAKKIKKGCGVSCRFKCHSMFTEEDRESIFHSFWNLGDATRQRQFLLKYSAPQKKKSKKLSSNRKRENSFMWTLPLNNASVRVCKTFFLHTLNISHQRIQTALKKSQNLIRIVELDHRGSHINRPNKTSQDKIDFVVSHIKSFPAVESHYCRKDSKKMYLSQDLSVAKMYQFYLEQCAKREVVSPVSLNMYRHIFNTQFNIAFQKPMKDQCDLCTCFKNATEDDKQKMKQKYDSHIKNKELARDNKEQEKQTAQENKDGTFLAACFDLEEVLMTPKAFEYSLYYKRRLNTFNFSIYNLGTSEAYCYLWNESISGRGACEVSSNVFDFLDTMSKEGKKEYVFYSDNCGAQNKNKYYVSMLWYAIQKLNLESVEQKYLEKGHTQNENDSVHACIERASCPMCIYTTAQWAAVIRTARRKSPYHVKEMDMPNFFDFKLISKMLKILTLIWKGTKYTGQM